MKQTKYEGYSATKDGRIFSTKTGKYKLAGKDAKGYRTVRIYIRGGNTKTRKVHQLVAETFIPNPDGKPFVNHIDGDKNNNSVENLEWCTHKENMAHAVKNGYYKGERKGRRKPVTIKGVTYEGITIASQETGLPISTVSRIAKYGDKWREVERERLKKYHTKEYRAKYRSKKT